jgi:succinate dehydrogenase / fumarate reductase, membrane anchor subunit
MMSKNTSAPQSLRSPLGRAKGLGSSRSGVSHWWVQRLTAMGMLPLVLYCLISFILIADADLDTARSWIRQPFNSVAMILLLAVGFYHASLGLQVVIEDYISTKTRRILSLAFTKMIMTAFAVMSIYSILLIALADGV